MAAQDDKEKSRILFNFLDYYDLSEYYGKLVKEGVTTISHLKATSDDSLRAIGFKGPEIDRIKKKLAQNFESNFLKKKVILCSLQMYMVKIASKLWLTSTIG